MNTRKNTILTLGLILFGLAAWPALASIDTTVSVWATAAPAIDGTPDDWAGVPRGLDKTTQVEYAFRNDAENLYVLCMFKDPKSLSTIKTTGLTIYFNTRGNTDKERGITFVQRTVGAEALIATLEKQGQTLTDERKQELRSRQTYMLYDSSVVDGKGNVLGPAVGSGQSLPPVFRVGRNGQEMAYELRIPLGKREDHPAAIGTAPGQKLMVEFEWGGLTKEMRQAMASRVGESGSRATEEAGAFDSDSINDGRDENSAPSSSLASMLRAPKRHSFWVGLTLASPGSN